MMQYPRPPDDEELINRGNTLAATDDPELLRRQLVQTTTRLLRAVEGLGNSTTNNVSGASGVNITGGSLVFSGSDSAVPLENLCGGET